MYVNKTKIYKFKTKYNISWYNFCVGSVSKDFTIDEWSEISLAGTVYDFSADHRSTNIHQYFIIKNHIKQCLSLLKKYLLDY